MNNISFRKLAVGTGWTLILLFISVFSIGLFGGEFGSESTMKGWDKIFFGAPILTIISLHIIRRYDLIPSLVFAGIFVSLILIYIEYILLIDLLNLKIIFFIPFNKFAFELIINLILNKIKVL